MIPIVADSKERLREYFLRKSAEDNECVGRRAGGGECLASGKVKIIDSINTFSFRRIMELYEKQYNGGVHDNVLILFYN